MSPWYYVNVYVHVLAAVVWLGGMLFLALVGAPTLRAVEPVAVRAMLFQRLGRRFRIVGWVCVAVLLASGILNLHFRRALSASSLGDAAFWRTAWGTALAIKLACVSVMIMLSALHDFVLGPAASRASPGTARAARLRRASTWIARANGLVGLVLLYAAVRLTRG